jgi:hypothetical protein
VKEVYLEIVSSCAQDAKKGNNKRLFAGAGNSFGIHRAFYRVLINLLHAVQVQ